jgi:Ulp1 family protease
MYRLPKSKKEQAIQRLGTTLREEDMKRVDHWRNGLSKTEGPQFVLGRIGNAVLTQEKFGALRNQQLLNDEIINASLHMYNTMSSAGGTKPSYCFTSFFYARLAEQHGGYSYENVRRWTKWKPPVVEEEQQALPFVTVDGTRWLNLFECKKVYIPVNMMNYHWFLIVLVMDTKTVHIIDSVGGAKSKYFSNICAWLRDEGLKVNASDSRYEGWKLEVVTGPLQENGWDCGVFTIAAADMCMHDLPLLYDQRMVPHLRARIAHELLDECINSM